MDKRNVRRTAEGQQEKVKKRRKAKLISTHVTHIRNPERYPRNPRNWLAEPCQPDTWDLKTATRKLLKRGT